MSHVYLILPRHFPGSTRGEVSVFHLLRVILQKTFILLVMKRTPPGVPRENVYLLNRRYKTNHFVFGRPFVGL